MGQLAPGPGQVVTCCGASCHSIISLDSQCMDGWILYEWCSDALSTLTRNLGFFGSLCGELFSNTQGLLTALPREVKLFLFHVLNTTKESCFGLTHILGLCFACLNHCKTNFRHGSIFVKMLWTNEPTFYGRHVPSGSGLGLFTWSGKSHQL